MQRYVIILISLSFSFLYYGQLYAAEEKLSISAEVFGQRENILKIKLSPSGTRVASLRNY